MDPITVPIVLNFELQTGLPGPLVPIENLPGVAIQDPIAGDMLRFDGEGWGNVAPTKLGIREPEKWRTYLFEPSGNSGQNPGILGMTDFTFLGTAFNCWESRFSGGGDSTRGRAQATSTANGICGMYGPSVSSRALPALFRLNAASVWPTTPFEEIYTVWFSTYGNEPGVSGKNMFVGFRDTDVISAPTSVDPQTIWPACGVTQTAGSADLSFIVPTVSGIEVIPTGLIMESGSLYSLCIRSRMPNINEIPDDLAGHYCSIFNLELKKTKLSAYSANLEEASFSSGERLVKLVSGLAEHVCAYRHTPTAITTRMSVNKIEIHQRMF